jgi:nucleoside-diphosphate-sugar epimerase
MKGLRLAVIGASGNVGHALVLELSRRGAEVAAISRTAARLPHMADGVHPICVDLDSPGNDLREALGGVDCVINVAHARFTRRIIAALPDPAVRLVTLGSARKFTHFPDQKAAQMQDAEAAHEEALNALILHPSMIYGGADNNISRIFKLVRWWPLIPLPQRGRALIQPIHRDDVVQCLLAAIDSGAGRAPMIIAGARPIDYAQVIRSCAHAVGRKAGVVSVPYGGMLVLAWMTRILPGLPSIGGDEVRRLLEDKAFDISPMRTRLGVNPCTFEEGLARMAAAGELAGPHAV